jgi:hypothetical protein
MTFCPGLALLYLTVLNFDNITFGFCNFQVGNSR